MDISDTYWTRDTPLTYRGILTLVLTAGVLVFITWLIAEQVRVRPLEREVTGLERRVDDLRTENAALRTENPICEPRTPTGMGGSHQ